MKTLLVIFATAVLLLSLGGSASAAVQVNDTTNVTFFTYVPCANNGNGEVVDLVGPLHTLVTFTNSPSSDNGVLVTASGKWLFNPQGMTGTGETTGNIWHATGMTGETFHITSLIGPVEVDSVSYVNNFRIIGDSGSLLVHETLHLKWNSSTGLFTVYHDNFSVDCK